MERAGAVIGVDTGGTFTDVFAANGAVVKVPSTPDDPSRAIMTGLQAVGIQPGDAVAHGTTVATNAVLERRGARTTLLTTAGFEDVLAIGRQNRPSLYDLNARHPAPLVPTERRLGVEERLDYRGEVLRDLDRAAIDDAVRRLQATEPEAVAICLLFSYANPEHEQRLAAAMRAALGEQVAVSSSHQVAPQYGEYERTSTTVVNAFLLPVMRHYLRRLLSQTSELGATHLHVMHSNGGLLPATLAAEHPVQTVLSGPAAGVVGAQMVAARSGHHQIITFDMGGTSTDVSLVTGEPGEITTGEVAGFPLLVPTLPIETVGAGGGSIARLDAGGALRVGPESAGADPGPAAYGRGDRPTVTDANLILGRLSTRGLLGGDMPLDPQRARAALTPLAADLHLSVEEAAWAVIQLANSNMERAVRTVTLQHGHDPRRFALFPFGGAGPLHGVELAQNLGIDTVLVPPHPGVMAALGLTVPDLVRDAQRTVLRPLDAGTPAALEPVFAALGDLALAATRGEEDLFSDPVSTRAVDLRFAGQSFEFAVTYTPDQEALRTTFLETYQRRYGYVPRGEPVEVVNARVQIRMGRRTQPKLVPDWPQPGPSPSSRPVWFGSALATRDLRPLDTAVLWRPGLFPGQRVEGPAVLEQYDSATVVPPGWHATVDPTYTLVLRPDVP